MAISSELSIFDGILDSPHDQNPLLSDDPSVWNELIDGIGPASILVVIESRMGQMIRRHYEPEDVWQEALWHLWRDRHRLEWKGLRAFRSLMLTIIDNRIRDLADREGALKRGGGVSKVSPPSGEDSRAEFPLAISSTTPGGLAILREQADAMRASLELLPSELREVVRMRLFEQLAMADIAASLGISTSAAYHRFRRGSEMYERHLVSQLASRSISLSQRDDDGAEDVGTNPAG